MPVFKADKIRKTLTAQIPASDTEFLNLEFYSELTVGLEREITSKFPNYQTEGHDDSYGFVILSLANLLKSWDLTEDEEGKIPTPVNVELAVKIFQQCQASDLKNIIVKLEEYKKGRLGASGQLGLVQ